MANAKWLCYALKIPLIVLSTLEVMALSVINSHSTNEEEIYFCPMIDARRMEIFTAIYDIQLHEILSPCAMILSDKLIDDILKNNKIIFFGSGAGKSESIIKNPNAKFINAEINPNAIAELSSKKFIQSEFENLAYSQPLYIKEFHTILNP